MNRATVLILLGMLTCAGASAQDWIGYHSSNYAGIHGVHINPALIAGNNYKLDVSIVAGHVNVTNNYIYLNASTITKPSLFFEPDFTDRFLQEKGTRTDKFAFINVNFQAPAFMFRITNYNTIAFAPRIRGFANADHVNYQLAKLVLEELNYPPYWNQAIEGDYMGINTNLWAEYGLSYGRIIYADKVHVFKGGITVKLLQGLSSAYLNLKDYSYTFYNDDTMGIARAEGNYGHSPNLDNLAFKFNFEAAPSVGFDIGFIYEYCPKNIDRNGLYRPKKYIKNYGIDAEDQTRYLWKIGVSVNDIGSLKYKKGAYARDFFANVDPLPLSNFDNVNSVASLDQAILTNFTQANNEDEYYMDLPTHLTAFFDYRFAKGFALNATALIAFNNGKIDDNKNHYLTKITLTPRWEIRWFGVYMPVSADQLGLINVGLSLRAGPLVIGTGDLLGTLAIKRKYSTLDLHFGLRIIIPDKKGKKVGPICPAYK